MTVTPLHKNGLHDSAWRHVTGEALYVDDLDLPRGGLHGWVVQSPIAHGILDGLDTEAALAIEGVERIITAADIPGTNLIGAVVHDEPVFAERTLSYHGQPVALVLATTQAQARAGAEAVIVRCTKAPAILGIQAAIEAAQFTGEPHTIARGDVGAALAGAALVVEGQLGTPAQNHFYLETQATVALPREGGCWHIISSTQHPTEVQKLVAEVLGIGSHQVVCEMLRMGGGFGGKESQSAPFACMAALGAFQTGRAVKVWLNREADMEMTGNRHPFWSTYRAGFDADGRLKGFEVDIYSDGGWSSDLSIPVMDRALFHLDNGYYIPALRFTGRVCRTHVASNTAFRGFGGPQGVCVIEDAIARAAEQLGRDPAELRRLNYYADAPRDACPYGQRVTDNRLRRVHDQLLVSSDYVQRRAQIEATNAYAGSTRRGIALQPVKFGISFTKAMLNQAGALVLLYADGTVQLNHGGTEMGQGLHAKMRAICAHELGVKVEDIRLMNTATDKVPNTSATAASSGSDLNGQAVKAAAETIRERMRPVAAKMLDVAPEAVIFEDGLARGGVGSVSIEALATQCWLAQISLSATGYYRTPGIVYDEVAGRGRPFFYYTFGAAVVEVEINALTGEHRMLRVDILNDAGNALIPSIDVGQVEGAFIQAAGWLTCEEVLIRDDGAPLTTGPSTYKIPAMGDAPLDFRVALLDDAATPEVIHGSKAVGEPPFVYGIAVLHALRHAVGAFGTGGEVELKAPATPERILRAIENQRQG